MKPEDETENRICKERWHLKAPQSPPLFHPCDVKILAEECTPALRVLDLKKSQQNTETNQKRKPELEEL